MGCAGQDDETRRRSRDARVALGLACLAGAYYASYLTRFPFGFGDEGYLYYVARQLGEGAIPYRDLGLTNYLPGLFYLFSPTALLERGAVEASRLVMLTGLVAKVVLMWACVRRLAGEGYAVGAAVLVMLVPGPWHKFYVGTLSLWLLYALIRMLEAPGRRTATLLGVAVGCAAMLRIDVAIAGAGLMGLAGVMVVREGRAKAAQLVVAPLVAVAVLVPMQLALFVHGALTAHWKQWISFLPRIGTQIANPIALPPPSLSALGSWSRPGAEAWVYYLTAVAVLGCMAVALLDLVRRRQNFGPRTAITLIASLWALSGFPQFALQRPGIGHVTQFAGHAVVAGVLIARRGSAWKPGRAWGAAAAGLAALFAAKHLAFGEGGSAGVLWKPTHSVTLSNGFRYSAAADEPYRILLEEVLARSAPEEEIAALPFYPGVAYATKRRLAHSTVFLAHYSVANEEDERSFLAELEARAPGLIFYNPWMTYSGDVRGRLAAFAPRIDAALRRDYEVVARRKGLWLMARRSSLASEQR